MSPHAPEKHDNLEAGLLRSTNEKVTAEERVPLSIPVEAPTKAKMPSPRRLLTTIAVCFLATFSLAAVVVHRIHPCLEDQPAQRDVPVEDLNVQDGAEPDSGFAGLLHSASPDILHRLLHAYFPDRYKHGVYPSDQDALAAVHEKNAPLATTLAQLAKRQNGNSTEPPTDTSEPPPDTTDPNPDPTDDPDPTGEPDPTPTDDPDTTDPPTSRTPDPTPDPTPTDDPDDDPDDTPDKTTTRKTTRTPSKSASATTMTTTLPDGGVTVITSTSYYDVWPAEETGTDSKPSATLQNASPRQTGEALLPVMLGFAIGGFMAA